MKGLKLIFTDEGAEFDPVNTVNDFDCVIQNALVNLGCIAGSDRMYPAKGTNLLKAGLSGALFDLNAANHASNFAALATQRFLRDVDYSDFTNGLKKLVLKPAIFNNRLLSLDAQFTADDGTVSGVLTNIL